ncbi:sulfatase-like hydrolase/transferase [Microlunatus soli]|uniref:Arylsulfatase A n=1 Tax=Microlunatus soli TaxID=630515 RepID=A0A1H1TUF4_9ACTN|nr:sulfatase-like hydrolase/transferase [Microlunatus soli]SDS63837.1 Arylsulfatase A [Microlunatus soli]
MPTNRRPNVLIISSDQQRFDAMGCYGNEHIRTPELDRLAGQGALFENAYSQSPMCAPSRASLMTGLFPRNHGLWANGVEIDDRHRLLSRVLTDAGYDCGLVGKFHLGAAAEGRTERRVDDGFRMFEWAHDPIHPSPQNAYHRWLAENHPDVFAEFSATLAQPWETEAGNQAKGALYLDTVRPEAHYSTWVAETALDFITDDRREGDQPFFLIANFFDPHHPFGAPEEFRALYDAETLPKPVGSVEELAGKPSAQADWSATSYGGTAPGFQDYSPDEISEIIASYYAMVTQVDTQAGRILRALDEQGLAEDTLVIFTSDHGEMLGDHGMILKGPMMYDCAVRVPLLIRWPDHIPAGSRVETVTQTVDLTSTILAATGMTAAMPWAQGQDLAPLTQPEPKRASGRDWALVEYRDSNFPQDPPIFTTMLRSGRHKITIWHGDPATDRAAEGELYDLDTDPAELHNLWHQPGSEQLRTEMLIKLVDTQTGVEDRSRPRVAVW